MDIKVSPQTVVCFDLDDTLYNEVDFLRSGFKTLAGILDSDHDALFAKMMTMYESGADCFDYLEREYGARKRNLLAVYRFHEPDISAFEGVHALFNSIEEQQGQIAIITDGRSMTQRNKLTSLGLIDRLKALVISEEIGFEKPDIRNFEAIQSKLPAEHYLYFGDNYLKDFVSPNALGWTTIGLSDNGKNIHKTQGLELDSHFLPQHKLDHLQQVRII